MKISNTTSQNWKRLQTAGRRNRANGSFSSLLKQTLAEKNTTPASAGSPSVKSGQRNLSRPADQGDGKKDIKTNGVSSPETRVDKTAMRGFNGLKLSDLQKPIEVNLGNLTEELKAALNEKYQIEDMPVNSVEFHNFLTELHEAGVISHVPPYIVPPNSDIMTDAEGNVTSIWTWHEGTENRDNRNAVDYFRNALGTASRRYKDLLGKTILNDEDRVFVSLFDSHQNIMNAVENIFSGQIKSGQR